MLLAPSVALVGIGLAIGVPGTPWSGLVGYWGIVVAAEAWSWQRHVAGRSARAAIRSLAQADKMPSDTPPAVETSPPEAARQASTHNAMIWQRTTRSRTSQGTDVLEGWLRCEFELGQRLASAHLAFCPPFSRAVQIDHRQLAGPESRVKISMLQPYGARFDVKLNNPCDQPVAVVIECTVSETRAAP
jgi:hypothetical protein